MRILITGAAGQLGQDLLKLCARRGVDTLACSRKRLDVSDLSAVRKVFEAEKLGAVINCAAYNDVDRAERERSAACLANAIGPRNLAIAAEEHGVPLMHFSSDYVFDGRKTELYGIAEQPRPLSYYGRSKLLGEQFVRTLCRRHFIVRLSWVFGANGDSFARKVIRWAEENSEIKIVKDQVSSPSYTVDLAPAVLALLDTGAYGLYHLTNSGHCSRFDWAKRIVDRAGLDAWVVPVDSSAFPSPAERPRFSAMDSFPLQEILGYEMPDWKDATERFLEEIGALK
ncbi:MAG: dTDP-4-dehydrorhamnose reductase [Deltaproteobacteria bacterium]|nr:dTDP-4-dehydrorhamnose reductase [Deltaproteobacteria bacterium]